MLLKELSCAIGVSGDEGAVRRIILPAIKDHVQDIQVDTLGNITAVQAATKKATLRVLLAAHMDEIGLMVMGFDNNGLIRFTNVGGIDERILPGLRVLIGEKQVPGVIIWTPIHQNQSTNTVKISNLRIDIGASKKEELNGKVKRGDRIAFDSAYMALGEKILRGKAFDDRAGCSLLIDILQAGPYPVDLLVAFTVQEEIGLRGARVAARRLAPDIAIVLEGTTAYDLPDPNANPDERDAIPNPGTKLGHGPALTVIDKSMVADPRLFALLRRIAHEQGIPYQLKTALGGGTDGGAIHLSGHGVPTAVVSIPCRYIHTPSALLHRDDYDNARRLLGAVLTALGDGAWPPQ